MFTIYDKYGKNLGRSEGATQEEALENADLRPNEGFALPVIGNLDSDELVDIQEEDKPA